MKKIYIDCTTTLRREYTTGIQRVVKSILSRLENSRESNFIYIPILVIDGVNYSVNVKKIESAKWTKRILSLATASQNSLNTMLPDIELYENKVKDFKFYEKFRIFFRELTISFAQKIKYKLFKLSYFADGIIKYNGKVYLNDEDILFVADSFWKDSVCDLILKSSKENCKNIILIYDVIAISNKNLFDKRFCTNFTDKLNYISKSIDGVITISNYSMIKIKNYMKNNNSKIVYDYFYLGADFKEVSNDYGEFYARFNNIFINSSVYLMVGTIEPRKNHAYVLDAFEKLWADGIDVSLCIVGREGWLCGNIINRILSNPEYNRRLWCFRNVDDSGLAYCYRHAKAQIIASIVEGFGLPLVEAMHYGKPVFASDIQVFREIGKNYPTYFDLADPQSLSDAISSAELEGQSLQCQAQGWLSWDESVNILLEKLEAMVEVLEVQKSDHV